MQSIHSIESIHSVFYEEWIYYDSEGLFIREVKLIRYTIFFRYFYFPKNHSNINDFRFLHMELQAVLYTLRLQFIVNKFDFQKKLVFNW